MLISHPRAQPLSAGQSLFVQLKSSARAQPLFCRPQLRLRTAARAMKGPASATPETAVPSCFKDVQLVFFKHPSAYMPAAAICGLSYLRLQGCGQAVTVMDLVVATCVVAFWLLQEWVVHKWLLHSEFDWMGKTIHNQHHAQPYHHVSLDPPQLILGVMALAAVVFTVLFRGGPLSWTAIAAYYASGLMYEWLHYVVHTRWVPPAGWRGHWLRAVRRHHMLHHMRNEDYWLSFSAPAVDALFGTLPANGSSVPLTDMARVAHGSAAAAVLDGKSGSRGGHSNRGYSEAKKPSEGTMSVCVPAPATARSR